MKILLFIMTVHFVYFPSSGIEIMPVLGDAIVKPERVVECPDVINSPLKLSNITIHVPQRQKFVINGLVEVTQDVTDDFMMELYLTRCEDKQQEYTCRFYMKNTVKDICPHIPEKGKIWSDFVQHMVGLTPACPIKPGSFVLRDAPIDTNEVKDLPIQYGFWKIRAVGKQNGKVTNCHLIEFYLLKKKGKTSIF